MPHMLAEGPGTEIDIMDRIVSDVNEFSIPHRYDMHAPLKMMRC